MARIEPEQLRDPERVFVARSLRLALRAEEHLTITGVDYAVQVESIGRSLLFGSDRMGAVIYVTAAQASYCREQLTMAGLGSGIVDAQEERPS